MTRVASIVAGLLVGVAVGAQAPGASPADIARQLLAADRALSQATATGDAAAALARAFADDVVLPVRASADRAATLAHGRAAAMELLRRDADLAGAGGRLARTPIRAGVSADGLHGFTYGYTTLTRADGTEVPGKYVAYWERGSVDPGAWRISVYRRVGRPPGDVSLALRDPALPTRLVAARTDPARLRRLRDELAETERAFSRDAMGGASIGAAFARYGDPSAANVGDAAPFTFGPSAIGASVQASIDAAPTRITWGPEETRIATSGDLGVTIGFITIERRGPGQSLESFRVPYFTIWRRDDERSPWRYVAE